MEALNSNKKLFGQFYEIGTLSPKKYSTIKAIITLASDKESVLESKKLVSHLEDCKKGLPKKNSEFDLNKASKLMKKINLNLSHLNQFVQVVDNVFDINDDIETEIIIDDKNLVELLKNMKVAKNEMEIISDYLNLIISIHDAKKHSKKPYSSNDLISILKAA